MDLYCKLYIETVETYEDLKARISSLFGGNIKGRVISDEFIYLYLKVNEDRDRTRISEKGGFVFSEYFADVEPIDEISETAEKVDPEIYLDLLIHIIVELRKSGVQVVASCEYEDLVARRTGWNWSETTPNHPSVTDLLS